MCATARLMSAAGQGQEMSEGNLIIKKEKRMFYRKTEGGEIMMMMQKNRRRLWDGKSEEFLQEAKIREIEGNIESVWCPLGKRTAKRDQDRTTKIHSKRRR